MVLLIYLLSSQGNKRRTGTQAIWAWLADWIRPNLVVVVRPSVLYRKLTQTLGPYDRYFELFGWIQSAVLGFLKI